MHPTQFEQTFMVPRSCLHQLCCEEASRSERRYHIGKALLLSLASDEDLNVPDSEEELFAKKPDLIRERVQTRVFPKFFGHPSYLGSDDQTDGVPRLCNALDFVTGYIRPEGTKLFSGITYFFKTLVPFMPGMYRSITTRPALAIGLRAVLVQPLHQVQGPMEVAVTASACVELKPWDTVIAIGV